jgi:hypothetical protein
LFLEEIKCEEKKKKKEEFVGELHRQLLSRQILKSKIEISEATWSGRKFKQAQPDIELEFS